MLHYNHRHVSSSTMLIFRRSNCIITASSIVTLCKRLYNTPVVSRLSLLQREKLLFTTSYFLIFRFLQPTQLSVSNINNFFPLPSFPISMLRPKDTQLVINDLRMGGVKEFNTQIL
jgi:hypothetical protein